MALLDEIYKTVKSTNDKVERILQWKAAHTVSHTLIERDVSEVRGCLFSRDGLMSRVQSLQGCKNRLKGKTQTRRRFIFSVLSKVVAVVVAAGIVSLVTWLVVNHGGVAK